MAKKNKKKTFIWVIVTLIILVVIWRVSTPKAKSMNEVTVEKGDITTYYSFGGNIEAKNRTIIIADQMMQIKDIQVKEGQSVKKEDVLFTITAGKEVKATIDGEVVKSDLQENAQVMAGTKLLDLVDYDNLQITVKVDEYDLSALEVGKKVTVTIQALDQEISGTIANISKEAISANGLSFFTAIIDLQKDPNLKVGMTAEARVLNASVKGVPVISMDAVQFDDVNSPYVYMKDTKEKFQKVYLTVGINDGERVEITEGLKIGELIYIPKTEISQNRFMGPRRNSQNTGGQK